MVGPNIAKKGKPLEHKVNKIYLEGKILFNPDDLNKKEEATKTENYRLKEMELIDYARFVTKLRQEINDKAQEIE